MRLYVFAFDLNSGVTYRVCFKILKPYATPISGNGEAFLYGS